jgi:pyrroline-5-carboxylate reductase
MNEIGIIGLGTLGGALARGLHRALPALQVFATTRGSSALPEFVTRCRSNEELVERAKTVLLCVKPQQVHGVLAEISPFVGNEHRLISTCAAVSLETLAAQLPPSIRIGRAMPNIACEFNEGITGVAFGPGWSERERETLLRFFSCLGEALTVEERHFDAVTAISGCGPAYVCVITEALSDAGVKAGLPREIARKMAVQMLLGSTLLIRNLNEHPAAIRDRVTTPGGCTIDALTTLEEGRFRATLIAAVTTAAAKSAALSR